MTNTTTTEELAAATIRMQGGGDAALHYIDKMQRQDRVDPFKAAAIKRHIRRLAS